MSPGRACAKQGGTYEGTTNERMYAGNWSAHDALECQAHLPISGMECTSTFLDLCAPIFSRKDIFRQ